MTSTCDEIFRHCLLSVGDRENAKQLMHDTFALAWKFIADGNYIDDMRLFLFRAATGLLKQRPEQFAVFDADALPQGDKVLAVLRNVEPVQRWAFILRYIDEFSIPQTAEILQESESFVYNAIEKGVNRITSLIGNTQYV